MKSRIVRRIGGIAPIHPAGNENPNRRRLLLHHPNLNRRSMRAQQTPLFARQVKSVLRIAGRMIYGRIERVKTMILILHFRPGGNGKAQSPEAPHNLLSHLRQRMKSSPAQAASGQAEVGRMLRFG